MKELPKGHPLGEKGSAIVPIFSWIEWQEMWKRTNQAEALIGLLHCGLDIPGHGENDAWSERVCFYLRTAYGYREKIGCSCPKWRTSFDPYNSVGRDEMRRQISVKAWKVLCSKFFSPLAVGDLYNEDVAKKWGHLLLRRELVEEIVNFFLEPSNLPNVSNFREPTREDAIVWKFLKVFVTCGWSFGSFLREAGIPADYSHNRDDPDQELIGLRPRLLCLINHLGLWEETFLVGKPGWKNLCCKLTPDDLEIIREFAKESWRKKSDYDERLKKAPFNISRAMLYFPTARLFFIATELLRIQKHQEARQNV